MIKSLIILQLFLKIMLEQNEKIIFKYTTLNAWEDFIFSLNKFQLRTRST